MPDAAQVEAYIEEKYPDDEIEQVNDPTPFRDFGIWEVWVHDGDEYQTRFVIERGGALVEDFGDFAPLVVYLNELYVNLENATHLTEAQATAVQAAAVQAAAAQAARAQAESDQRQEAALENRHKRHLGLGRFLVASLAFLSSVAVLLWLVIQGREPGVLNYLMLGGVIASGAALFFGIFIQPGLPIGPNAGGGVAPPTVVNPPGGSAVPPPPNP